MQHGELSTLGVKDEALPNAKSRCKAMDSVGKENS